MPKTVAFEGVKHTFPDDFTDAEISAALSSAHPSPAATAGSMLSTRLGMAGQRGKGALVGAIPAAAAIGGGMVGGVPGATLGGLGGEALRRRIAGESLNLADPAVRQAIEGQGVTQGGAALVGQGVTKGLTGAAKAMMQGALRPTLKTAATAPTVAQDVLAEGGTVTQKGVGVMSRALGRSGRRTRQLLGAAGRQGSTIDPTSVVPSVDDLVSPQTPHLAEARAEAEQLIDSFLKSHPNAKTPLEAKDMKVIAGHEAEKLLEGRKSAVGKRVTQAAPLGARFQLKLADNLKAALEALPKYGKLIGESEAKSSRLINATGAVKRAEAVSRSGVSPLLPATIGRGATAATGATLGALAGNTPEQRTQYGLEGLALGTLLGQPGILSQLAYAPNSPIMQWLAGRLAPHAATMLFNPSTPPLSGP